MPSTAPYKTFIPIVSTDSSKHTSEFEDMIGHSLLYGSSTSDTKWQSSSSSPAASSNGSDDYFDDHSAPSPCGSVDQQHPYHNLASTKFEDILDFEDIVEWTDTNHSDSSDAVFISAVHFSRPSDEDISTRFAAAILTNDNRSSATNGRYDRIDRPHSPSASPKFSLPKPELHCLPTTCIPNSRPSRVQDELRTLSRSQSGNAVASSSKTPSGTESQRGVGSAATVQACHAMRRKPEKQEEPFLCPKPGCMANFTAKHYLMNHTNSHKGTRAFLCCRCERKFGTHHVLARHIRFCKGKKGKPGKPTPL